KPRRVTSARLPDIAADAERPGPRSADDDPSIRIEHRRAILSIGPKTLRGISRLGWCGPPWRWRPAARPGRRIAVLDIAPYGLARCRKPVASNSHRDGLIRVAANAAVQPDRRTPFPNRERGIDPAGYDLAIWQHRQAVDPVALRPDPHVVR